MADTENTRAPAGGSEPTATETAVREAFGFMFAFYGDDQRIPAAFQKLDAALASAPAAEPLPLTILRELVEANKELAAYKAADGLEGYRRMRARERAAWLAAHNFISGVSGEVDVSDTRGKA